MIKNIALFFGILMTIHSVSAFEDCIVINNGRLTDINIEDNTITDVFPLITVMNEKNTLIVHPLKAGKTRFCALKNEKNLVLFEVEVTETDTIITAPDGFEVFTLDSPVKEYEFELDIPPGVN